MSDIEMPVTDRLAEQDVCVVGGGLAGLCAAVAAAREGARTALVHDRPVLGGNASTEIRIIPYGAGHHNPCANETGIVLELLTEERARSADPVNYGQVNAQWDLVLYNAVRREKNLQLLLNTHVAQVNIVGKRIRSVTGIQLGTERVWEITAKLFMDCSGDGVVGLQAGVPCRVGQEARSEYGESLAPEKAWDWTLGSSLLFRARDVGRPVEFTPPAWAERYPDEDSLFHRDHRRIDGGYWWIEIGFPWDTIRDNETIRDELLRHLYGVWDHIKNLCVHKDKAANWLLDWVGMVPGKRESRRFIGAHVMTQTEIQQRTRYPDRIAYGGWIIDDHTKAGILAKKEGPNPHDHVGLSPFLVAPYSVPLRSLYAREVPNLLFAGRVMSASRLVFNSLRVMRTLAVIGQAAGTAAAHSIRTQRLPHEFSGPDLHAIQQSLLRQDCYIPRVRNEDPDDVARGARVTASSSAAFQVKPAANGLALTRPLAQILPLSAWPERVRVFVRNKGSTEAVVRGTLHRADDIWDLPALEKGDCAHVTLAVPPNSEGPVEANVEGAASAPGLFWLRLAPAPNVTWLFQADPLPGCTAAKWEKDSWMFAPGTFTEWPPFAADVLPLSRPFGPENIVNGVARPETWPNVWLSEDGLPQWCRLELPNAVDLERIQMAWGLNFHRTYSQMPPFFRAPECSRDYRIEVECGEGTRRLWAEVRGNYQRLRVHNRPPDLRGPVRAIVITIAATNGVPQVEIAEVRVYRASGRRP